MSSKMVKDKKPGILGFQTKDALKNENLKLCAVLSARQASYREIRMLIDELNRDYVRSKANVPMVRYTQFKDMIKKVTDKKVLQKLRDTIAKSTEHEQDEGQSGVLEKCKQLSGLGKSEPEPQPEPQPTKGAGLSGLLQRCKEFAGETSNIQQKEKDLQTLSKQEVVDDNEKKRKDIRDVNEKFPKLLNHLEQLQKSYEEAKKLPFTSKYTQMKKMIKLVINDNTL